MLTRREFLRLASLAALSPAACVTMQDERGLWVNDVHSQLNATRVSAIETPRSIGELADLIRGTHGPLCLAGGRHAMGGQQFASGAVLVDVRRLDRVLSFDAAAGIIEIESGIQWPALIEATVARGGRWGIAQKQTGADRLTLGGSVAANVHGRGLTMKPLVGDLESFVVLDPGGNEIECSRTKNAGLFAHVAGGYGLFGVVTTLRLRLAPRRKVERVVEVQTADRLADAFSRRIADGFLYGDFQFAIDDASTAFLRDGVFSCYRPVADDTPIPSSQAELRPEDWTNLLLLAHADKEAAYRRYVEYYLGTSGQVYWSDEHQLSFYPDDYHRAVDTRLQTPRATEMISELYVPRLKLAGFLAAAAEELRRQEASVVYGTVRLIERDDETMLPWARQPYACVIFNLHVEHGAAGIERSAEAFRGLIDLAIAREGSYFLTYHRWARREQVEACYPRLGAFLREKRRFDPHERFTSEWFRHYARMFEA